MRKKQRPHLEAAILGDHLLLNALIRGAKRWTVLIGGPAGATIAVTFGTLLATVILLRVLPDVEAGLFVLTLAVLETLVLIAGLGQNNVLTRRYSIHPVDTHDWPRDLAVSLVIATPVILVGTLVSSWLYDLPTEYWAFLLLALILRVPLHSMAYMLTAKRHYTWGNLLLRLPNALLILPALVLLVIPSLAGLNLVLLWLLASLIIVDGLGMALLIHHFPRGKLTISLRQRADGLIMLASTGSRNLPTSGLIALAGAILLPGQLAIFAAMAIIVRPFTLASNLLVMVLTPELIRDYQPSYTRMIIGLWTLAVLAGAAAVIVGPPLASWAYGGRYDDGATLIPLLALAGSLRFAGVLPRSHLFGRAETAILSRYVIAKALSLLVAMLLGVRLTYQFGIVGLAGGIALIQLADTTLDYGFLRIARSHEDSPLPRA